MRIIRVFVLPVGILICSAASAQSLEERVRELERRVEQLEKQQIERQPASHAARNSTTRKGEGWKSLGSWRSLKLGMTENEVRSILGDPDKVDVGQLVTMWYYDTSKGGRVRFSSGEHRVEGWTEPEK